MLQSEHILPDRQLQRSCIYLVGFQCTGDAQCLEEGRLCDICIYIQIFLLEEYTSVVMKGQTGMVRIMVNQLLFVEMGSLFTFNFHIIINWAMELSHRSSFTPSQANKQPIGQHAQPYTPAEPLINYSKLSESLYTVSEKETYKSRLRFNIIVLNIALASFYYGYCMVYFSQLNIKTMLNILDYHKMDVNTASGLLNGCIPIGALFGALLSSIFVRYTSRRNGVLIINACAFVVGGLIYIENFYSLLVFRLLQGVFVGMYSSVTPIMIKQLSPIEISGSLGSYTQLMVAFGMFFGCFFSYILSQITGDTTGQDYWYYVYGFPQLTIILQTIVLLFVYPFETPKYLLLKGQEEKAKELIEELFKQEFVEAILEQKKADVVAFRAKQKRQLDASRSGIKGEDAKKNWLPFIVSMNLSALRQFSGTNAVTVYAGNIASSLVAGQLLLLIPSIVNFATFFGSFLSGFILSKFGRKTVVQAGTLAEVLANLMVVLGLYLSTDLSTAGQGALVLVGLFLCKLFFGTCIGPITWQYMPEVIETTLIPYTTTMNWVTGSIVITLFPILTNNVLNGNPGPLFMFFIVYCALSFVFNWRFMVETRGRTQTQIQKKYREVKCC